MADPTEKDSQHDDASRGHEYKDVNINAIFKFTAGLAMFVIVVHVIILLYYAILGQETRERETPPSPLVKKERKTAPASAKAIPQPRLQVADVKDLQKLQQAQQDKLNSYGWVDEDNNIVHIPIEKVIDMLLMDPEKARALGMQIRQEPKEKKKG